MVYAGLTDLQQRQVPPMGANENPGKNTPFKGIMEAFWKRQRRYKISKLFGGNKSERYENVDRY